MNPIRVAGGFSGCSGGKGARLVSSQVKNDESTCRGPYSRIANCGIASALALRVSGSGFMGLASYTGSGVARQRHVNVDRSKFHDLQPVAPEGTGVRASRGGGVRTTATSSIENGFGTAMAGR